MANLAILGHKTRGKEVIKVLSMLGGYNTSNWYGDDVDAMYLVNTCYHIDKISIEHSYARVLSLEEFLERFPYKVGDKVQTLMNGLIGKIIKLRWHYNEEQVIYTVEWDDTTRGTLNYFARNLQPYKETIEEINISRIGFNGNSAKLILPDGYEFKTEGKEVYVAKKQPCKEETNMKENTKLNLSAIDYNNGLVGYEIPEGYEFDTVIDNKVVIKKLKPTYPKTYKECCVVLINHDKYKEIKVAIAGISYKADLITSFTKLLICRDAYWKIAGEEMGLDKPWEPDWLNDKQDKYVLFTHNNAICSNRYVFGHNFLAFPTEEMRDIFYENFKNEIEQCKELL